MALELLPKVSLDQYNITFESSENMLQWAPVEAVFMEASETTQETCNPSMKKAEGSID